jgi:hypothetical protein
MKAVLGGIAVGFCLGLAAPGFGQEAAGPAEEPPAHYPGREYVDTRGCAFARGTVNGATVWLMRVDAAGRPVCGLEPSVVAQDPAAAVAQEYPVEPATQATPAKEAAATGSTAGGRLGGGRLGGGRSGTPVATRPSTGDPAPARTARKLQAARAMIPAERLVIAVGTTAAKPAGCGGPERPVPLVTLRSGARHAACEGLPADLQAFVRAQGAAALGPALPPLDAPATMVHVGAYRVAGNAERAAAQLRALGLPVARGSDKGGKLALVLTGPFGVGQVREVVARLLENGFPDAYADVGSGRDQPSQMP